MKTKTKHTPRPKLIDPDPIVIIALIVSGMGASAGLFSAVTNRQNRLDAKSAKRKTTKKRLAQWGRTVRSLDAEIKRFQEFIRAHRVPGRPMPVLTTHLKLTEAEKLLYKDFVTRLTRLVNEANASSLDLAEMLLGEEERRMSRYQGMLEDVEQAFSEMAPRVDDQLQPLWGAGDINGFLEKASRLTGDLARFETTLQELLSNDS